MTIEDLGNLGDLIAAIATVATLAYLALQIRHNSKSVEGATVQSILDLEVTTFSLKAQYANVYRRGCANLSDLDEDEKIVFEQVVSSEMSLFDSGYVQWKNGLMPDMDPFDSDWKEDYLKRSGFQAMWSEIKSTYPRDFCDHLEKIEKEAGLTAKLQVDQD